MGYVVLYICFLKVPVGARPESFGGEYNCLFVYKQTHCCTPYTRTGPLDKEAPEEHIRHPLPCNGSGSAGKLLSIMLVL